MNRQRLLAMVREDLQLADKHLQDASDFLDRAIQVNRNPFPTKNTQERVKLAAQSYRRAIDERAAALSRVADVMANDISLRSLKPRRPRMAQNGEPNPLKQSA